jgi:hypothetical protein
LRDVRSPAEGVVLLSSAVEDASEPEDEQRSAARDGEQRGSGSA